MNLEQTHPFAIPLGLGVFDLSKFDPVQILQVTGPVLIAIATGYWATRQARVKASADAASGIQTGFTLLIKELQNENVKLIERLERQSVKMDEQSKKIGDLEEEIRAMARHVDRMERALSQAGVDVPPKPNRST